MKIDGGCHCGQITYEAEIDPARVAACHCTDCQTLSGAPFRVVAFTLPGGFKLLSGEPKVYIKRADSGKDRQQTFCPNCGAPIYSAPADPDAPQIYGLRVGTIRQRDQLVPKIQVWTRSAQHWLADLEDVRKEPEQGIKV
jgi:hypothetical protein